MNPNQPFEKIQVTARDVVCDGAGGVLGHPKTYLHIDDNKGGSVTCPYCSRMFIYRANHQAGLAS
jgi:uncharacterized Zn-finger protein